MLNSFPQTAGDVELRLRTFEAALKEVPDEAIIEAAGQYVRGEVKDQDTRFAPSVAEFCNTARQCDALATHKLWLRANSASLQPLPEPVRFRPVPDGVSAVIDGYRANYKERLKDNPNLKYVDSIRMDFQAATGKALKLPDPKPSARPYSEVAE